VVVPMVFTVPVRIGPGHPRQGHRRQGHRGQGHTRRAVLTAAAAAVALAGCSLIYDKPNWQPGDEGLDSVYADALMLAARYTEAIDAMPTLAGRLHPILDSHRAHAEALADALGRSATSSPPPAPKSSQPTAVLSALAAAERAAADRAAKVCLAASLWRAPLLASIAACRASNVEALA
jgi:hypothetical protein